MKSFLVTLLIGAVCAAFAADVPPTRNTYSAAYGETKAAVTVDPAKDLPRYPAVEPKDAVATWRIKRGFKIELAAHEPQIRDPIAVSFDESGRMFVCEMIDYSEEREHHPHWGRISVIEDKDGDGIYETSHVFADDLPWPTGLIWANGGLYVGATPDIWRFEDRDGDGRAEVREKVFTGFGTGLARLNVQSLMNSFEWGPDNRIHVQTGNGNRGKIKGLKTPDVPEAELGGRNFWFDPLTYAWGFESAGGQYGMSFDDFGQKFTCSNSDHLQMWVYDDRYARNPFFTMPPARQSIAADGGAAEVFRISPDEPWRIIRTRWRIAGVVKGPVEGGGRVSGYFTGASGTRIFRGDAYGPDFVNNSFSADSGSQLAHRKKLYPDGASLIGRRPDDEQGFEFAASTDTWVRTVNFANAPDGCLYIIDMYREIIEHPWSLPEEIKKYLDLNSGNDRGRLFRVVPDNPAWHRRAEVHLGNASIAELVATLSHPNGWHRDTAARLLHERQDRVAVPLLAKLIHESPSGVAKLHALSALDGLGALNEDVVLAALTDGDAHVRERGILMAEKLIERGSASPKVTDTLATLVDDRADRVRMQLAFTIETALAKGVAKTTLAAAYVKLARRDATDKWVGGAVLGGPPEIVNGILFPAFTRDAAQAKASAPFVAKLIEIRAASKPAEGYGSLIDFVAQAGTDPAWIRALGDGLRRAGVSIDQADTNRKLAAVFSRAAATAANGKAPAMDRLGAMELLSVASESQAREPLVACLVPGQPEAVQSAAIKTLAQFHSTEVTAALVRSWPYLTGKARETALAAFMAREDRSTALLRAIQAGSIKPTELPAAEVQHLVQNKNAKVAALAHTALASVIPPSREEVAAKYQPAVGLTGNAAHGKTLYTGRCSVCHRADGEGLQLGPDLITVKSKGRDALLTAILNPHKEVAPQYIAYDVMTKDGNAYTGIIEKDDATGLSLKIMGGAQITIPRSNIKGSSSSGKSLMPEGLEAGLSIQDMADLLTFIEELK